MHWESGIDGPWLRSTRALSMLWPPLDLPLHCPQRYPALTLASREAPMALSARAFSSSRLISERMPSTARHICEPCCKGARRFQAGMGVSPVHE